MPDWVEMGEDANIIDFDAESLTRFYAEAIPVPERVLTDPQQLSDERRYDVPVTAVCPEYTAPTCRSGSPTGSSRSPSSLGPATWSTWTCPAGTGRNCGGPTSSPGSSSTPRAPRLTLGDVAAPRRPPSAHPDPSPVVPPAARLVQPRRWARYRRWGGGPSGGPNLRRRHGPATRNSPSSIQITHGARSTIATVTAATRKATASTGANQNSARCGGSARGGGRGPGLSCDPVSRQIRRTAGAVHPVPRASSALALRSSNSSRAAGRRRSAPRARRWRDRARRHRSGGSGRPVPAPAATNRLDPPGPVGAGPGPVLVRHRTPAGTSGPVSAIPVAPSRVCGRRPLIAAARSRRRPRRRCRTASGATPPVPRGPDPAAPASRQP